MEVIWLWKITKTFFWFVNNSEYHHQEMGLTIKSRHANFDSKLLSELSVLLWKNGGTKTYFAEVNCNFNLCWFQFKDPNKQANSIDCEFTKESSNTSPTDAKMHFAMCWVNYLLEKDVCSCTQCGQKLCETAF